MSYRTSTEFKANAEIIRLHSERAAQLEKLGEQTKALVNLLQRRLEAAADPPPPLPEGFPES